MKVPRRSLVVIAAAWAFVVACSGKSPTQPTAPAQPPTTPPIVLKGVRVAVAGNASTTLEIGQTRQFVAQGLYSDETVIDVTNVAVWQSSDPVVAPVSPTGVLTAVVEGAVDVKATYSGYSGTLHADIEKPRCHVTLDPNSLVFNAFAHSAGVTVTTSMSTCRWKAAGDAKWLTVYQGDPGKSGNGSFYYEVTGNNNTEPRTGNIVVTVDGGPTTYHVVQQERPANCVYQVSPERLTFNAAGGTGEFQVTTTPGDCQWRISESWSGIQLSTTSGTGARKVSYTVAPNQFEYDRTFRVAGLSGANPPGTHTVSIVR